MVQLTLCLLDSKARSFTNKDIIRTSTIMFINQIKTLATVTVCDAFPRYSKQKAMARRLPSSYKPPQETAKDYIAEHRVQQMFSSILSALMMHKPKDPVDFIQNTLDEVGGCIEVFLARDKRTYLCT